MKKFLSVLLALAVAFTFTFGSTMSAFAATYDNTDKYIEAVNTAEAAALEYEAAQYAVAVAQAKTAKTVDVAYDTTSEPNKMVSVDTAYYLTQLEAVYAAIQNNIKNVQTKALKSVTGTPNDGKIDYDAPAYTTYDAAKMLSWAKQNSTLGSVELNCATALIAAQLDANKAVAVKNVGTVDTTIYSTTKLEEANALKFTDINNKEVKCYSAKEYADALKADYIAKINAVVFDKDSDTLAALGKKVADLDDYVASIIEDTNNDGVYTMKASIKKAADEDAENAEKAAKIAAAKTTIQSNIATEYARAIKAENYNKAEWDKLVAAYTTVENYLAENADYSKGYTPNPFPTNYVFNKDAKTGIVTIEEKATGYINAVANAELINAAIAAVKAEKNEDGTVKYIAESVDKAAESLVDAVYKDAPKAVVAAITATEAKTALAGKSTVEVYVTAMQKAQAIKTATDAYDAAKYDKTNRSNTYYPAEYATYKAALDAYATAVNAAVTNAEMTKAGADLANAIADIKKASEIAYTDTATDKAATALANAKATAKAYKDTLNVGKDEADQITYTDEMVTEFLMYNGARDAAGIVALYDALKADIANTETPNQAKAAAAAVQAKIDALPATLTLTSADEASVLAVKEAYDALSDAAKRLVNAADLTLAMNKMADLVEADITAAAKAINKDLDADAAKIADKEALKAVAEKCEAYTENYGLTANNPLAPVAKYASDALDVVKALECKAVVDAVKALPTEITKEDKAAVEAARAAYDAYVAEYTDLANGKDGAADLKTAGINLEKLQAAEATIAELTKYDNQDAKADLLDMSRKLTIWRTSKTSIKVTAVGSVKNIKDNGYTVKYSFYKKAPGATSYKLVKTTTSNKYTYTNLKKGTNKFQVKVKVYDADGKLVATKMTYYRAAKVK